MAEVRTRRWADPLQENPARARLRELRDRVRAGETITLPCSSSCTDEARCHRAIPRALLLADGASPGPAGRS